METQIAFSSGNIRLEGLLKKTSGTDAIIITHPHPLMGGDMYNHVVKEIQQIYSNKGLTTLRFNFRGTGRSTGEHDNGDGEVNDIVAAHSFLLENGYENIHLAGYSFGAYVSLGTACRYDIFRKVILVSPPVDFMDFSCFGEAPSLYLVVTGEKDTYASPASIKKLLKIWNKNAIFKEISRTDHFYSGSFKTLEKYLIEEVVD